MKKIFLLIIIFVFSFNMVHAEATQDSIDTGVCTMQYDPVCAEVQVQCIKAPCDPIQQTFSNMCEMNKNKLAKFLHKGKCNGDGDNTVKCIGGVDGAKCGSTYGQIAITDPCLLSDNASRRVCASSLMRQEDRTRIEEYVKNNISEISNDFGVKEVLGGKFYVSNMSWVYKDSLNLLQVEYEDGHVAYTANIFAFTNLSEEKSNSNKYGIKVDLFYLVKDNGETIDRNTDNQGIIENYIKDNISSIAKNYNIESGYGRFYVIGEVNWIDSNNSELEFNDGYDDYIAMVTAHLDPSKQGTNVITIDNLKIKEKKTVSQEVKTNILDNQITMEETIFSKIKNFLINIFNRIKSKK